jgi:hypothetical protein
MLISHNIVYKNLRLANPAKCEVIQIGFYCGKYQP